MNFENYVFITNLCKLAICKSGQFIQISSYVMEHGTYFHFILYIYILYKKYASDSS